LSGCSLLRYLYLAYLSQPASERQLYRGLRTWRSRSIVEIGMTSVARTGRLLEVAQRYASEKPVRYTGIDLFEARPESQPRFSLKAAHQQLQIPGVRVQLAPGDPLSALQRLANTLVGTDLLLIGAGVDAGSLQSAWFFVPRMLHERSRVLVEEQAASGTTLRSMTPAEIQTLAARQKTQRRAA